MSVTIAMFGTEFAYERPRSPSRLDELLSFWRANAGGEGALRAAAAVVCGASGVGRAVFRLPLDPSTPIASYATACMDAMYASNAEARDKGDKAPRPYLTGKQLIEAALALVPALTEDAPVLEWEVADAVGNSAAPPTSS